MITITDRHTGAVIRSLDAETLAYADLHRADLTRADLHGADLHGANLVGANLYGADLHGAKDRWVECGHGIHCFLSREEAEVWGHCLAATEVG